MICNFRVTASKRYKRSVFQGFVFRIYRASSSWEKLYQGLIKINDILKRSQHPLNFHAFSFLLRLKKLLNHVLRKLMTIIRTTRIRLEKLV